MIYVGRIPSAGNNIRFGPSNALGETTVLAVVGPSSGTNLRTTLEVGSRFNTRMATLAVNLPGTRRILHRTVTVNTSGNVLMASEILNNTSA